MCERCVPGSLFLPPREPGYEARNPGKHPKSANDACHYTDLNLSCFPVKRGVKLEACCEYINIDQLSDLTTDNNIAHKHINIKCPSHFIVGATIITVCEYVLEVMYTLPHQS